jgi:hypothetical protein
MKHHISRVSDHPADFLSGVSTVWRKAGKTGMADIKKELQRHLEANDLAAAAARVVQHPRTLPSLIRISYDRDTLAGWRSIIAVGLIARKLVARGHDLLRDTCRKLLWSLNDESGGIGWSAPELLGEIVSADTKRFADIVPLIAEAYHIEGGMFKAGVLYALARVAAAAPELAAGYQDIIDDALRDRDPLVRIRGLELVGAVATFAVGTGFWQDDYVISLKERLQRVNLDKSEAWIYGKDEFYSVQVCAVANNVNKLF